MFWFFGHEACEIFAPWPGIAPVPSALEVLTAGLPEKYRKLCLSYTWRQYFKRSKFRNKSGNISEIWQLFYHFTFFFFYPSVISLSALKKLKLELL